MKLVNQKGIAPLVILFGLVILTALGLGSYYAIKNQRGNVIHPLPSHVACTQEAKQCPDGSYVGRSGSSCEFAPCQSTVGSNAATATSTSNWQVYTDQLNGFQFSYPPDWKVDDATATTLALVNSSSKVARINIFISKQGYENEPSSNAVDSVVGGVKSRRTASPNETMQMPYVSEQLKRDNTYYQIDLQYMDSNAIPIFDTILRSFKFTN